MRRFLPGVLATLLIEALLVVSFVTYQVASHPQSPGYLPGRWRDRRRALHRVSDALGLIRSPPGSAFSGHLGVVVALTGVV